MFVAINWNKMWIGVKGLSSLELAGSSRKVCRHVQILRFLRVLFL